jgi:hypothetical protein
MFNANIPFNSDIVFNGTIIQQTQLSGRQDISAYLWSNKIQPWNSNFQPWLWKNPQTWTGRTIII